MLEWIVEWGLIGGLSVLAITCGGFIWYRAAQQH